MAERRRLIRLRDPNFEDLDLASQGASAIRREPIFTRNDRVTTTPLSSPTTTEAEPDIEPTTDAPAPVISLGNLASTTDPTIQPSIDAPVPIYSYVPNYENQTWSDSGNSQSSSELEDLSGFYENDSGDDFIVNDNKVLGTRDQVDRAFQDIETRERIRTAKVARGTRNKIRRATRSYRDVEGDETEKPFVIPDNYRYPKRRKANKFVEDKAYRDYRAQAEIERAASDQDEYESLLPLSVITDFGQRNDSTDEDSETDIEEESETDIESPINREDLRDPTYGDSDVENDPRNFDRCLVQTYRHLKDYQEIPARLAISKMNENRNALLIAMKTGTGKTLTGLFLIDSMMREEIRLNRPVTPWIILAPPTLLGKWQNDLLLENLCNVKDIKGTRVFRTLYQHVNKIKRRSQADFNRVSTLPGHYILVDEIHTFIPSSLVGEKEVSQTGSQTEEEKRKGIQTMELLTTTKGFFMMTATPIAGDVREYAYYHWMFHHKGRISEHEINQKGDEIASELQLPSSEATLRISRRWKRNIFCRLFPLSNLNTNTPMADERIAWCPFSQDEDRQYADPALRRNEINNFQFADIRKCNGRRKIQEIIEIIRAELRKSSETKILVLSAWTVDTLGIGKLKLEIDQHEDLKRITMDVSTKSNVETLRLLGEFNHPESVERIFLGGRKASTGLDFHGVTSVILMDPLWREVYTQQQIGRAVRTNSHRDITDPVIKGKVTVYHMLACRPNFLMRRGDQFIAPTKWFEELVRYDAEREKNNLPLRPDYTADQLIYTRARRKARLIDQYHRILELTRYDDI